MLLTLLRYKTLILAGLVLTILIGLDLRIRFLKSELRGVRAELVTSKAANRQCDAATKAMKAAAVDQQRLLDDAADSLQSRTRQLAQTRAALAKKEATDHAIPACEALLRTDLSVCPAHADALRLRAAPHD